MALRPRKLVLYYASLTISITRTNITDGIGAKIPETDNLWKNIKNVLRWTTTENKIIDLEQAQQSMRELSYHQWNDYIITLMKQKVRDLQTAGDKLGEKFDRSVLWEIVALGKETAASVLADPTMYHYWKTQTQGIDLEKYWPDNDHLPCLDIDDLHDILDDEEAE